MKWLVQTHDALSSHCPEEQAIKEQKNLEALILRYKNLIPSIEITMVKTDTFSKCYSYRREVREVCEWLKIVREQSKQKPQPQSLQVVNQLIKHQEVSISQLDERRPVIMSLLQKGKELSRDANAPSFIPQEVKTLETGWTETYDESVQKLHTLLTTQHLWERYEDQKQEIVNLLERGEQNLQRIPPTQYNPQMLPNELVNSQQLCIQLREDTDDLLKKLRETSDNLGKQTGPEQYQQFNREVHDIEQRLNTTLTNVQEHVVFLQEHNTKWTTFQTKLTQLQNWTTQTAPHLLSSVQEDTVTPEDRLTKTNILQSEVVHKVNLLDELGKEAQQLAIEDNPEAQKLKADLVALQDRVVAINKSVESQAVTVNRDLKNWQAYQSSIQEIKPWVEQAEIKVQTGVPKPGSLEEAILLQSQAKDFAKECEIQQQKLQGVQSLTQKMEIKTNAPDEVDSMQTRWTIVHDTAAQWGQKLDKLVTNWVEFDKNAQHLEHWIDKSEKLLAEKSVNLNTPNVDKLEKELAKLKAFNNEISEQQAKLIALTQTSDSISYNVNPEGAAFVKNQVQELKTKVTQLAEGVRAKINDVSDAILAKHDFQTKVSEFSNWLENIQSNAAQIDEIPADKVESALINVHNLLQEHHEKQPLFNQIYSEVKEITLHTPQKENEGLNEEYTTLVQHNQEIEHRLQEKKYSLERWIELLNWHGDTNNQLSHIKNILESEKNAPENLQKLTTEINTVIEKIVTWKQQAPAIDSRPDIVILDKQTALPRSADNIVREIEVKAINLKSQLADKLEGLQKVQSHWNQFENIQQQINADLNKTANQLQLINADVKHSSDLPKAVELLGKLLESQVDKSPVKEELRKEALQLMKEDIQNVSVIQNSVSTIESNWNKVNEDIKDEKLKLSDIIFAWNEFQEAKDRVVKDIGKIDKTVDNLDIPNDIIQANINFDKAKKALEALKKTKTALDKANNKGQTTIKKAEDMPGIEEEVKRDLQIVQEVWSRVYEKILRIVQTTESQSTIWKHIEDTKNNLLQWVGEQNTALNQAAEKPNEVEVASVKLAKYKEELPAQQRLKQSIPAKYTQLLKLTDGKEIPNLQGLVNLLDDQFVELDNTAQKLESLTSTFGEKDRSIRNNIKDLNSQISGLREEIIKCEDLSGDNNKILQRLLRVKDLKQKLLGCDGNIKQVDREVQVMRQNYPTFGDAIPKEQQMLKKRYEDIIQHTNKIENSLLNFLKKFHKEKYGALQRIIDTHKDKIQWCQPEPSSDKYNLQVKLNSLEPIQKAIQDCDKRKDELENSLALLEQIESPESFKLLTAEKDHVLLDLDNLKQSYANTKEILERNIAIHDKYDSLSDAVASWLKETENRVKAESSTQIDLNTVDNKIADVKKLQQEVLAYEKELKQLAPISEELVKEIPESRVNQYVQHFNARYDAITKFLTSYLEKLDELNKYKQLYRNSINDVENWLVQAEDKVKTFAEIAAKPNQATLEELKKFASEKEKGQTLLSRAVEHGEALFSGITPENREAIRTELRTLRDKSEGLLDRVNVIYKQVESTLMQRHSFDDSLQQVHLWITDAESKLGGEMKLDSTLLEKKQTLHNYKTLSQDVNLHKTILKQLQDKIGNLSDADAENKLQKNLDDYNNLAQEVNKRIDLAEDYVTQHDAYNQAIEKCHDWLSALTSEAALLVDETSSESPEAKLTVVENLLAQTDEGNKIIASCKAQLDVVLAQTAPAGHPPLINSFQDQEKSWKLFLELCSDAQEKLNDINNQYAEVEKLSESLEAWLKQKEYQVKDQSLRNTEDAKRAHLEKLKNLEKEIIQKEPEFNNFSEIIRTIEPSQRLTQLLSRYQHLKNNAKEAINRYEGFVKEHQDFNEEYDEFLHWLSGKEEELQDLCHIVGDLNVLQNRQKEIRELIDERNQRSGQFDNLLDKGERLYAHTSPDGREIVRQKLRNIRTIWDTFAEDLQSATNKLDQCLLQFSDFTAAQEQLTKWLKDVEKAMHQHTELKSTLQEKRAQLQNHKIMHQEIMSHTALVESVCDKAQQLVDQTHDKSLNVYLQSIKHLFASIVTKSEELLKNLESCVETHNSYNQQVAAFKDWIGKQNEKLQEFDDVSGEKTDITKRIAAINTLKKNSESEGNELLDALKQQLIVVAKSTAPKGVEILKGEFDDLNGLLKQHIVDIGKCNELIAILIYNTSFVRYITCKTKQCT